MGGSTAALGLLEQSGCVLSVHGARTATRVPRWDGQGSTDGGDSSQAPRPPAGLAATCLLQTFNFSESPDLPFIQVCPIAGWDGSVITFLLIPHTSNSLEGTKAHLESIRIHGFSPKTRSEILLWIKLQQLFHP